MLQKERDNSSQIRGIARGINDMAFEDIGYSADREDTFVWQTDWSHFYGKLAAGTYRIVKEIRKAGDGTKHMMSAEFVVESCVLHKIIPARPKAMTAHGGYSSV